MSVPRWVTNSLLVVVALIVFAVAVSALPDRASDNNGVSTAADDRIADTDVDDSLGGDASGSGGDSGPEQTAESAFDTAGAAALRPAPEPTDEVDAAIEALEAEVEAIRSSVSRVTERWGLSGLLVSASSICDSVEDRIDQSPPTLAFTCDPLRQQAQAPADGRVVAIWRDGAPLDDVALPGVPSSVDWSFADVAALSPAVVIDHGPLGEWRNVASVIGFVDELDPSLAIGDQVTAGQPLGRARTVVWQPWFGGGAFADQLSRSILPADEATSFAALIADDLVPVVDERCPFDETVIGELPNAAREYRNGIHRGVDFVCAALDRPAYAGLDGTVVLVVDDFESPDAEARASLLAGTALLTGGRTPHWILTMLYGNHVVIDHGTIDGRETWSISAHLDTVAVGIMPGAPIAAGDEIGTVGSSGTAAGTEGPIDGDRSVHLHWELIIDGSFLAEGLDAGTTSEVYRTLLCGEARPHGGC